jgi:hypothetical protein
VCAALQHAFIAALLVARSDCVHDCFDHVLRQWWRGLQLGAATTLAEANRLGVGREIILAVRAGSDMRIKRRLARCVEGAIDVVAQELADFFA